MYELVRAGEKSWYIDCPVKIGIYQADESGVYLIDSGGDKDAGRRVRKILDEQGWTPRGFLITPSNADHIGGNRYLQQQYGCKVFSAGIEAAFTCHPILEPSFLYGGYPFAELRHKFLMAQPSDVTPFSHPDFPKEVALLPLPGHFFDMVGFRLPDGVVFLADCLTSAATLDKYKISFIYDVKAYLETLDMVMTLEAPLFVPAHAQAETDIRPLAQYNRDKVMEVAERITALCGQPIGFETLLQRLFTEYGLQMTYEQYVLVGSTVRSYLSWLKDAGALTARFEDNLFLWEKA